jgi:hypothetical protein
MKIAFHFLSNMIRSKIIGSNLVRSHIAEYPSSKNAPIFSNGQFLALCVGAGIRALCVSGLVLLHLCVLCIEGTSLFFHVSQRCSSLHSGASSWHALNADEFGCYKLHHCRVFLFARNHTLRLVWLDMYFHQLLISTTTLVHVFGLYRFG